MPHRLTIDVNVVRDLLDSRRDGHKHAAELFARNGSDIDLAIAAQGHRLDATGLLGGELREALVRESISETRQLAHLSEATYPSENLFPGQYVDGFKEAWAQIIDTWKTDLGRAPVPQTTSMWRLTCWTSVTSFYRRPRSARDVPATSRRVPDPDRCNDCR